MTREAAIEQAEAILREPRPNLTQLQAVATAAGLQVPRLWHLAMRAQRRRLDALHREAKASATRLRKSSGPAYAHAVGVEHGVQLAIKATR